MARRRLLPGTRRWQREALTEGIYVAAQRVRRVPTTILRMVPLPVPGEDYLYIPSRMLMPCSTHIFSAATICDQPMQLP